MKRVFKLNGIPAFAGMTLKENVASKDSVMPAPSSRRSYGGRKGKAGIPFFLFLLPLFPLQLIFNNLLISA